MSNKLREIFNDGSMYADRCLSDEVPCMKCPINEEATIREIYGSPAERNYPDSTLLANCPCMDKLMWEAAALLKLSWYEKNDERLKERIKP